MYIQILILFPASLDARVPRKSRMGMAPRQAQFPRKKVRQDHSRPAQLER